MKFDKSKDIFEKSKIIIPGGVNSPVRAFGAVNMDPPIIAKAKGSHIYDIDGNEYIDYICSWGPMILGHNNKEVLDEILKTAKHGTSFGAPTELEYIMAKQIVEAIHSIEMVRMVNSGTEAVMSAIRLARGFTKKDKILKFEGCYHGHSDGLLIKSGSGLLTTGIPDSNGVPADYARNTINTEYNNLEKVEKIFKKDGNNIAGIIVEPVAGNMGIVLPNKMFLEGLRDIATRNEALLIFDEVITGFRLCYGGGEEYFGVQPDITTLGKIIGGGLPVGAYGGSIEIMSHISPIGGVYQAGTLSGNPIAMSAGLKTLQLLKSHKEYYDSMNKKALQIKRAFESAGKKYNINIKINQIESLISPFFTDADITNFNDTSKINKNYFEIYFKEMFKNKIYLPPSPFEAMFLSIAHTDDDINKTEKAIYKAFEKISLYKEGI